ncbi:hypothetical protein [Janthinobacterium sp. 17J80-10]|uniref:hypothetical protein n=1 Tax=Janthinobacterium sp. 17J80-10 TaxID=2497863 RepID=UPI0010055D34|nr:hypothetical protein [Janthinobacterium sp. 17J80-10]QAU32958.1 hypothetical protein EKL02_01535 [Janthinobacterium sp. 17J80-10]
MLKTERYLQIVRASAWYDLVVTIGFATPWTFAAIHSGLNSLIQLLGLPGGLPPFAPEHMLMTNLLGSIVTVWAILRLRDTQVRYGRYDAAGRFLFATWQIYALAHGAHPILLGFIVVELGFGIAQILPVAPLHPGRAGIAPHCRSAATE